MRKQTVAAKQSGEGQAVIVPLSEVKPESVIWLWDGHIPIGTLTILEGDPGVCKSLTSLDIAARVSTTRAMPDGTACMPGGVILLNAEDGLADTVAPRLAAAGADPKLIVAMTAVRDNSGKERLPDIGRDVERIEQAIEERGAVLVIIDPLNAYLPEYVNAWSDHDIRRVLTPLAKMAERSGVAVLVVRHLNKAVGSSPIYRGGGSIGVIAAARAAFLIARDPTDSDVQILAPVKFNLGEHPPALAFTLASVELPTGANVRIEWRGEVDYTAAQLQPQLPPGKMGASKVAQAMEFLSQQLSNGPIPSKEIEQEAETVGISLRTLERAKARLGVTAEKAGFGREGEWDCTLPDTADKMLLPVAGTTEGDD